MTKTLPLLTLIMLTHASLTASESPTCGDGCQDKGCDTSSSVEALLKKQCEHKIPTYTCDECRYETGIVKLAPELLSATNGQPLIRLGVASLQTIEDVIEATGEVCLNEQATVCITPPVPGILRNVFVDSSATVKAGDILFEVQSAELGEAVGTLLKNRTLVEVSRQNVERENTLVASNVSAQVDLDNARARLAEDTASLNATLQRLQSIGLSKEALASLGDVSPGTTMTILPLRAPRDGIIIEKRVSTGNRIQPGDTAMILSDITSLWVRFDIHERDLAAILAYSGQAPIPVTLTTRAFPSQTFTGQVEVIGSTLDEITRTIKGRALVGNPGRQLRPGMFCTVRLALATSEKTLAVSRTALLEDEGQWFVFKHLKENYYIRQAVKKGRTFLGTVEILEGLSNGEPVVTEGSFLLKSDVLREKMGAGCAD